jgi:hypothetical protein
MNIHQHNIGPLFSRKRKRRLARIDQSDDGVAKGLDRRGKIARDEVLIFDNQQAQGRLALLADNG